MSKEELSAVQRDLADIINSSDAFKQGFHRLKLHELNPDAPYSPYRFSLREVDVKYGTFPLLLKNAAEALHEDIKPVIRSRRIDLMIGIPNAGNPLARELSKLTEIPFLTMEKDVLPEGRRISAKIHGDFKPDMQVLGIDDLVTGANTKFEFIEALEQNGLQLAHLAVVLDRQQGGMEKLKKAGVNVSAVLTTSQIFNYYREIGRIQPEMYDKYMQYMASEKV